MGKFIKIFVSILIALIVVLTIFSYMDFGGKGKIEEAMTGCKTFTIKVDSKSTKNIAEIVNTLANTSTVGLAFKSTHLRKIGAEVDKSVPSPLTFLGVIFGDKKLAKQMKVVKQSSMKYNNFCEGLYKNMFQLYKDPKCFKMQLDGFSKALGLDPNKTFTIAETCGRHGENGNKDAFRPFVDYLIEKKGN